MILNKIVEALPATVPFTVPEAIERSQKIQFQARMGANENAWGTSPKALSAGKAMLSESWKYNDPNCHALRSALASTHGVSPEALVFGEGIDGLLGLIVRACVVLGSPVVMSKGSYPTFEYHVKGYGGELVEVDYSGYKPDLDALAESVLTHNARLVYLANPDNPSGHYYSTADIRAFLERIPVDCMVLLDEAYIDYVDDDETFPLSELRLNLIRTRTFSKIYGLASLRVGYAVGHPELIEQLDKIRLHFGVGMVGQCMCLAALDDIEFLSLTRENTKQNRQYLSGLIQAQNIETVPSRTNFILVDMNNSERSIRAVELLMKRGVFVRRPGKPPLDRFIRVTVGTEKDCDYFAEALGHIQNHL